MDELRLPKEVESDPAGARLARELVSRADPLWANGELRASTAEFGPQIRAALRSAYSAGRIVRGLEGAERILASEEQGLKNVDRKTGVERGRRVSRLLVLANDGSERFYREVESLLQKNAPRVMALRLAADEHTLGEFMFGPGRVARLVLVEHKDAVSAVLLALAKQWGK